MSARRLALAALVAAPLLTCAPAFAAEPFTPPQGAQPVVQPGASLVLRSEALNRDVRVTVRNPYEGNGSRSPVVFLLAPSEEVAMAAAAMTETQLTQANYGAFIVSVEVPGVAGADAQAQGHALYDPDGTEAKAFERFFVEELVPFARARWPEHDLMLAGSGPGALFAVRMAAQRPDLMKKHLAVALVPTAAQVDAVTAGGRKHPDGYAGDVRLNWDREYVDDPSALERLSAWLNDHGHAVSATVAADGGALDLAGEIAEWIAAQAYVPPT